MYYEINVARMCPKGVRYEHLFATAPRSIKCPNKLAGMVKLFNEMFPAPKYSLTVSKCTHESEDITDAFTLKNGEKRSKA